MPRMSTVADSAELFANTRFDNRFTRELPADPETRNFRRQVPGACFSRVQPLAVTAPRLVAWSREVAGLLDLSEADCRGDTFTQVFAGNKVRRAPEMLPMF